MSESRRTIESFASKSTLEETRPVVIRADHPFAFAIQDQAGIIVFMGVVENPK
jgi:serine protease inhibitor